MSKLHKATFIFIVIFSSAMLLLSAVLFYLRAGSWRLMVADLDFFILFYVSTVLIADIAMYFFIELFFCVRINKLIIDMEKSIAASSFPPKKSAQKTRRV